MPSITKCQVLIVGAGPSGLTAAATLARYGIDFIIIDDDPAPTEQSRAAIVHVRTLEIWDKLGFVQNAISQGVKIRSVQVRERGRDVANLELAADRQAADTPFPYALGLPQSETEKLYVADLLARGRLIEWNTRLNALDCRDGEVLAHVSDKSGGERTPAG
jgi:2-polyprenyl-6-methoxyphenol hydroxylase-like FAD-dependent oxidoreductase